MRDEFVGVDPPLAMVISLNCTGRGSMTRIAVCSCYIEVRSAYNVHLEVFVNSPHH